MDKNITYKFLGSICVTLTNILGLLAVWKLEGPNLGFVDAIIVLLLRNQIVEFKRKLRIHFSMRNISKTINNYFPDVSTDENSSSDDCSICLHSLSNFRGGVKRIPTCGHLFHSACIREVVERAGGLERAKCPVCRSSVLARYPMAGMNENQPSMPFAANPLFAPAHSFNNENNIINNNNDNNNDDNNNNNNNNNYNNNNNMIFDNVADQILFRFTTFFVPSWIPIPNLSFEVIRRTNVANPQNPNDVRAIDEQMDRFERMLPIRIMRALVHITPMFYNISRDEAIQMRNVTRNTRGIVDSNNNNNNNNNDNIHGEEPVEQHQPPTPPVQNADEMLSKIHRVCEIFPQVDRLLITDLLFRCGGDVDAVVNYLLQNPIASADPVVEGGEGGDDHNDDELEIEQEEIVEPVRRRSVRRSPRLNRR